MIAQITCHSNSRRLILIFAGWAMDNKPFEGLCRPGYDIAVVWDYRSLDIDWSFTNTYDEICLIAWSLGVSAVSMASLPFSQKISARIAVNGTKYPVDSLRGIDPQLFKATLDNISPDNLRRFYRRIAGSSKAFAAFMQTAPERDCKDLACELSTFFNRPQQLRQDFRWDLAMIGTRDAIFLPEAQRNAWHSTPIVELDAPHLPDFQFIIDRFIIDKNHVGHCFAQGFHSYDANASIQHLVAERLIDTMCDCGAFDSAKIEHCLEVGCGTGLLTRLLIDKLPHSSKLELWDLAAEVGILHPRCSFKRVDAETAICAVPDNSLDMIASASTVQWFNSPARFLRECARTAKSGTYVAIATYIKGNLGNLSLLTGKSLPLLTAEDWQAIIPDDFDILSFMTCVDTLSFDTPLELFRHLKNTGVNSLGRTSDGENSIRRAINSYPSDSNGKYILEYRPLIFILKKR